MEKNDVEIEFKPFVELFNGNRVVPYGVLFDMPIEKKSDGNFKYNISMKNIPSSIKYVGYELITYFEIESFDNEIRIQAQNETGGEIIYNFDDIIGYNYFIEGTPVIIMDEPISV